MREETGEREGGEINGLKLNKIEEKKGIIIIIRSGGMG